MQFSGTSRFHASISIAQHQKTRGCFAFLSLATVAVRKKDDSISTTIEAMTTLI
jgi:hypothetical protein